MDLPDVFLDVRPVLVVSIQIVLAESLGDPLGVTDRALGIEPKMGVAVYRGEPE
jgi:hypothetical protein